MDSAIDLQTNKKLWYWNKWLVNKFKYFWRPAYLCEILKNIIFFMIPENDVNKMLKKISMEVLSLIGFGKTKEALRFFDPKGKTHNP